MRVVVCCSEIDSASNSVSKFICCNMLQCVLQCIAGRGVSTQLHYTSELYILVSDSCVAVCGSVRVTVCCRLLQCIVFSSALVYLRPLYFVFRFVCCSVLHSARCSVLPCVAVCCSVLQCVTVRCSVLQCVAVRCRVLQCVAVCCSVLQCVAVCCRVLQCVAVR